MIDCPKFVEKYKMFQGKYASNTSGKLVADVKTIIVKMNVVDVNVTTRSRIKKELHN